MKSIRLKYFAMLREKVGLVEEVVETQALSYQELFIQLDNKYHFNIPIKLMKVAENNQFISMDNPINDGAIIAFIPPVAGG